MVKDSMKIEISFAQVKLVKLMPQCKQVAWEQRDDHHGSNKVNEKTRINCSSNTVSITLSLILEVFANPGIKTFKMQRTNFSGG